MTRSSKSKTNLREKATQELVYTVEPGTLELFVPSDALAQVRADEQRAIPALARDLKAVQAIESVVHRLPTHHDLRQSDSRCMNDIPDESVHLAVTSPPYWNLKAYPQQEGQLGLVNSYEDFLAELDKVWRHVLRVLVPGGRLVVVVGDVCLARRTFGRHVVFPLHSSIQEQCRKTGFDNLAPIIWYKITNAQHEVENGSKFLGKPYEPNAIIKNDIEYILFQRKPGGYRQPGLAARILSVIPQAYYQEWFQQIWTLPGASTRQHPAPFPLALAERLVRMFSFVDDTVLDPFMGTGTTNVAARRWGRHSIGLDIEPRYVDMARLRLQRASQRQYAFVGLGA
ncbi:MAG: site-specific DNA-methyltransferase [Chloroflexota bacterium]|nr:site-specific DNA-methyltransferase [Chloroflexota bacterium]